MRPRAPSGVHIGCTPPPMSTIDSRRWPRCTPAPASIQNPSASGPRWLIASFIRLRTAWSPLPANPDIPHTFFCLLNAESRVDLVQPRGEGVHGKPRCVRETALDELFPEGGIPPDTG